MLQLGMEIIPLNTSGSIHNSFSTLKRQLMSLRPIHSEEPGQKESFVNKLLTLNFLLCVTSEDNKMKITGGSSTPTALTALMKLKRKKHL